MLLALRTADPDRVYGPMKKPARGLVARLFEGHGERCGLSVIQVPMRGGELENVGCRQ